MVGGGVVSELDAWPSEVSSKGNRLKSRLGGIQ